MIAERRKALSRSLSRSLLEFVPFCFVRGTFCTLAKQCPLEFLDNEIGAWCFLSLKRIQRTRFFED